MEPPGTVWLGSVVLECRPASFLRLVRFWSEALHYTPREPLEDWALLRDPTRTGPNLAIQQAREEDELAGPAGRFHLDLYSNDPQAEVERLERLGAGLVDPFRPGRDFATLSDPDGNLFDVIDARHYRFGQRGP